MAPLCGKPLTPKDRKVWNQAIALLMGLKRRNGFGVKDLTAAVGTALRRGARPSTRNCEDCGVKVAGGATINSRGPQGGFTVPLGWRFLNSPGPHIYSCT